PEPFKGLVVEIDVADLDVLRKGLGVDSEPMILRGDLDLAALLVSDRMVRAVVAELELERPTSERLPQELMTQTDPENGDSARLGGTSDQRSKRLGLLNERPRVAGSIGDKDSIGLMVEDRPGGCRAGHNSDAARVRDQVPGDVPLHPEV